jgi:energy-coupling factor transporter transmembrane protein EcfT
VSGPLPARPGLDSPLGRRDPAVKLGLLALVSGAVLFVLDPVTPAVLYLLALAAVLASTRAPVRLVALAHLPFAGFGLGLLVVNALSRPGQVLATAGPLTVTDTGLSVGAALALRTLLVGVLSIGFVVSTDPVALVTSLRLRVRLGARATYALLAGLRMLEDLPREWQTVRAAQRVRRPEDAGVGVRARAWARAAFALLVVSIRRGERMSVALEGRGVGLPGATVWRRMPLRGADLVMALGVVATVAGVLVASAWLGVLRGPGALVG